MFYLCPDCKVEVIETADDHQRSMGGFTVSCPNCEYTAPDYHFCELVDNPPKGH